MKSILNYFKIASNNLQIFSIRFKDNLRTNNAAGMLSFVKLVTTFLPLKKVYKIETLLKFSSYFPNSIIGKLSIKKAKYLSNKYVISKESISKTKIHRSIIIKPYISKDEPGFLLVSFENELENLLLLNKFSELSSEYKIIFLPTWHPFYSKAVCFLNSQLSSCFFLMPSDFSEKNICEDFSSKCVYLPLHAASWVNDSLYTSPNASKSVDIVMIANFSSYKRHWRLFEALSTMPSNIKVVLAGVQWGGRTKEKLYKEARLFNNKCNIDIFEGISDNALRKLLADSRLFCALSSKEGSYIAVAEALVAGVPVAMYETSKIGCKAYINDKTGFLLSPLKPLGKQLEYALDKAEDMEPHVWARENISAKVNIYKLNDELKKWSLANKLCWSRNILPFYCNHFNFYYYDQAVKNYLINEYQRLESNFGLNVVTN